MCDECRKPFDAGVRSLQRFCSLACRAAWAKVNRTSKGTKVNDEIEVGGRIIHLNDLIGPRDPDE